MAALFFLKHKQMLVHDKKKVVELRFLNPEASCFTVVLGFDDVRLFVIVELILLSIK